MTMFSIRCLDLAIHACPSILMYTESLEKEVILSLYSQVCIVPVLVSALSRVMANVQTYTRSTGNSPPR
jgi:hypothetical protein